MRVCLAPFYKGDDQGDGGIRRVVEAQIKYLPSFGWDVTDNPDEADLIACHGATLVERVGVPMVAHCHGLLWEDYFAHHGDDVNRKVIDVMVRAQAVTAPSRWVAHAISRGMLIRPEVIHHGVDADAWTPTDPALDYVLWNKARIDPVSDPADMQRVAALLPDIRFLSTYGEPTPNVLPMGVGTYEQMRPVVQRAAVYLATARETFGIGTIEALAAGVPIAGWDYGGQHEIVIQGNTGYLAPFGDYQALADCIRRCIAERERLSANARADARARWAWPDKIAQYAALYTRVVEQWRAPRPKVSVVVTAYNLGQYVLDAVSSVMAQTMDDYELLIVDDCSTDETQVKVADLDKVGRIRYLRTPQNLGLAGARNYGWQHARGKYILFLDADDMLAPNALDILSTALDRDSSIHIAYGALDTMAADGTARKRNPWPAGAFSWHAQLAHLNQLHGASLMRREVLERSGGYRARDWRSEDASFWSRVTSFGFRAARVTDDTIQIYRMHEDQKSKQEDGDGDWTAWYPWRLAGDPHEGMRAISEGRQPNPRIVPFGAQGVPPAPMKVWPVRHFQHPVVSVVIPVGPGHAEVLIDALDSVQAQTFPEWECIVVNDTGVALDLTPWPWVRQWEVNKIEGDLVTRMGAGGARNWGLRHATAPLIVFLDADDLLHPRFIEEALRTYDGHYIYTDWATLESPNRIDGEVEPRTVEEYDQRAMLRGLQHAVTTLLPAQWVREVGGFDEGLPAFEDWDFYNKLAVSGYCGKRLAKPLLIYRHQHGRRTRAALKPGQGDTPAYTELGEQVAAAIADRYAAWRTGEEPIMGCCNGGNQQLAADALNDMLSRATNGMAPQVSAPPASAQNVRMEFVGNQMGAQTFIGRVSGRQYRAGREQGARFHDVDVRDVEHFLNTEMFRVVGAIENGVGDGVAPPTEPRTDPPRPKGRYATQRLGEL
jgi:glycosyltransferase involved in cell wall biosynthesis